MNDAQPSVPQSGTAEPPAAPQPLSPGLPPAASTPTLRYPADHTEQFEQEFRNVTRVAGFYAAMLLPVLVATGWSYHTRSNAVEIDFWISGVLYAVIMVYATIWRRDWWDLVRLPTGGSRRWLIVVGLTPPTTIGAAVLLQHLAGAIGLPVQDIMAGYGGDGYPVWLLAIEVIVLAPVFEEIAFRGVLMSQLQRVMPSAQAIWVAATLFGVLHFSVLSMAVFLVPLGAVAGYLARETRSLLPAIAIHAAHNAGIVLLSL